MQRHSAKRLTPEEAFSAVLREVRTEHGISQEKLGFECGYHRTYIGLLERGKMNPTLRVLLSIAAALKVPAAEIVTRVESKLGRPWKREAEEKR